MTARVRFSNGQVVQYNSANQIEHHNSGSIILKTSEGYVTATIPAGSDCIVEWVHPCSVEWPGKSIESLSKEIRARGKHLSYTDNCHLADLKRYLDGFDARRRCWK